MPLTKNIVGGYLEKLRRVEEREIYSSTDLMVLRYHVLEGKGKKRGEERM